LQIHNVSLLQLDLLPQVADFSFIVDIAERFIVAHTTANRGRFVIPLLFVAFLRFELLVQPVDVVTNFFDLQNQALVLLLNAQFLFFIDQGLLLVAFPQRMHRRVQILHLVFVLLFDVGVNLCVFLLLVLNISNQLFFDVVLQHVVVVDVSTDFVNGSFEAFDELVVGSDLSSRLLDQFHHLLLSRPQVINQVTQISVDLVEFFESLVHQFCIGGKLADLHLARSDIPLEFRDLVVEDKFEFLQFLRLLLEDVDVTFSLSNLGVLNLNILELSRDFNSQLLDHCFVLIQHHALILNATKELHNLRVQVS